MKTTILSLLTVLCATTAQADDLSLYIEPNAGESTSHEVAKLQKMTFESGNVVLTAKDGTTVTTAISDIKRMYFDATATAIDGLLDNCPTAYTIHSANGVCVASGTATSAATIDMGALPHGLYIISIKDKNFKIVK